MVVWPHLPNQSATFGIEAINSIIPGGKINPALSQARTGFDVAVGLDVPKFGPRAYFQAVKATLEIGVQPFAHIKPARPQARGRVGVEHGAAIIEFPEDTASGAL
jgi:hypothetical protein